MRRFNPEKELRKIQSGNRNRIIFGVMALLLILTIGSSYALYQIRYNKQIIYTTVAPFNKRDVYLAVKVNGEYKDKFPDKEDNYSFSGYECDGNAIVTFDPDKWVAYVGATGPDKCTIKFGTKNINYDEIRTKENIVVDETRDVNLRYIGKTPSNYIWFNCNSYENLTNDNAEDEEHNCEIWRIIGLMNNMTIVNEDTKKETPNQSLIKIIRADSIGNIPWNIIYSNDWGTASLQKGLNGPYLEDTDDGTWITEPEYTSSGGTNTKDDSYKSITSNTLNMIENVKWNLGAHPSSNIPPLKMYEYERGTIAGTSGKTTWNGKIALLYVSDYVLATNGSNNGKDRSACLTINVLQYHTENCLDNDWLLLKKTHYTLSLTEVSVVLHIAGRLDHYGMQKVEAEYPTLYLKSSVKIIGGNGTVDEPYILTLN